MNSQQLSTDFQIICPVTDLPVGKSKRITVGETAVALFHIDDGFFAIEDACSHQGASLAFGSIEGVSVACSRHGAVFDIRTGDVLSLPALRGVKSFLVKVEDGKLMIATTPVSDAQPALLRL